MASYHGGQDVGSACCKDICKQELGCCQKPGSLGPATLSLRNNFILLIWSLISLHTFLLFFLLALLITKPASYAFYWKHHGCPWLTLLPPCCFSSHSWSLFCLFGLPSSTYPGRKFDWPNSIFFSFHF